MVTFGQKKKANGPKDIPQLIQCLWYQDKDLSSNPSTCVEKHGAMVHTCDANVRQQGEEDSPELLAGLVYQRTLGPKEVLSRKQDIQFFKNGP